MRNDFVAGGDGNTYRYQFSDDYLGYKFIPVPHYPQRP